MYVRIIRGLPPEARHIREAVFMQEQGFQNEFDEIDARAVHLLLCSETGEAVAVCRVFEGKEPAHYILGRLAVLPAYRGRGLGAALVHEAERFVCAQGGSALALHAQCRVQHFYERAGYQPYGALDDDEGVPHVWMRKALR